MRFEFYVLNYNVNAGKVVMYNIFGNTRVQECVEHEIRKYLRGPKKYGGIEKLCEEVRSIIRWQEWGRREYEISVGDAFEEDLSKYQKIDCAFQADANIKSIVYECIRQYKEGLK